MILAYLDTNVFSHLLKREQGITAQHEADLRAAISAGRIVIPLSYLNLEETIAAPSNIREAQSRLILELASRYRFVNWVAEILRAAIRSFARYGEATSRAWISGDVLRSIHSIMNDVLVGTNPQDVFERAIAVRCAQADKESYRELLRSIRRHLGPAIRELQNVGCAPSFEWFFDQKAVSLAEWFADNVGLLGACRSRGIEGLLKIPAIKMAVGASLSFVYAAGFKRRQEKPSDSRDVLHATLAAAVAGVFVTHDKPLRECLLQRVPLEAFRKITLPELLDEVAGYRRN